MSPGRMPPRAAHWLLDRTLPDDVREMVLDDLDELFQDRVRAGGTLRASLWYWREAVSFASRFATERMRERAAAARLGAVPSWLDFRLGARMLVKSPLLTVTGCVAIATAIGINAGFNEFMGDLRTVATQLERDDRLVALANYDLETGDRDPRLLEDMQRWREGLETVEHIGAVLRLDMGLVGPEGRPTPVDVAEMSASGFEVAPVVPLLGRPLLPGDDGPGAEPVLVLSEGGWERHLASDPDVVGTVLRVGDAAYRVVGVMPSDFSFPFPVDAWVNFRRDPAAYPSRAGPPLMVFGRLATDRTLEEARAEIAQLGQRAAADQPETHARLRPAVAPFSEMAGVSAEQLRWGLRIARTVLVMLLIVACANIATLVFARNAGRTSEIAVRTALGAGRGRIVTQLFTEALVLALVSAGLGLVVADRALRYGGDIFWEAQRVAPPFWWDPGLSLPTVLYGLALAVLGAAVVGVLPALRATGKRLAATLQTAGSGGSALAFGRLPTAVIVVQIAIAVALFPVVLTGTVSDFRDQLVSTGFETDRYLTARILVDSNVQLSATAVDQEAGAGELRRVSVSGVTDNFVIGPTLLARYAEMRDDVARRLESEPGVRSVALTTRLPGILGESIPSARLEVDGQAPRDQGWWTRTSHAELEMFEVLGREMAAGRPFTNVDYAPDQRVAIVNQAFVTEVLGGSEAVGRLVRGFDPDGDPNRPWTEIVGVIPDEITGASAGDPQVYYPLSGEGAYPVRLLVEVDGDPATFAPRLQALAAEAEPSVILDEILPLENLRRNEVMQLVFQAGILGFVALVTGLLATAGVYALMSFIVSQRTREIGIRTALGADPARVLRGVFMGTFVQLALGVAVGLAIVGFVAAPTLGRDAGRALWLTGAGVSAVLVAVGLLGCWVPVRRALSIQPTEALRADG